MQNEGIRLSFISSSIISLSERLSVIVNWAPPFLFLSLYPPISSFVPPSICDTPYSIALSLNSGFSRAVSMSPVYGTARRSTAIAKTKSSSDIGFSLGSAPSAGVIRGNDMVCGPTPKQASRWFVWRISPITSSFQLGLSPKSTPIPTSFTPASIALSKAVSRQW